MKLGPAYKNGFKVRRSEEVFNSIIVTSRRSRFSLLWSRWTCQSARNSWFCWGWCTCTCAELLFTVTSLSTLGQNRLQWTSKLDFTIFHLIISNIHFHDQDLFQHFYKYYVNCKKQYFFPFWEISREYILKKLEWKILIEKWVFSISFWLVLRKGRKKWL